MKIGIIVYSETGHTLQVATALAKRLEVANHQVTIEAIAIDGASSKEHPTLTNAPKTNGYEVLCFASSVQGFSLAPAMKTYLEGLERLSHSIVVCFLTQHFKKAWLGGTRSLNQMKQGLIAKGANSISDGIVHWSAKDKDAQIVQLVERLAMAIEGAKR
jgi:flavodoxin